MGIENNEHCICFAAAGTATPGLPQAAVPAAAKRVTLVLHFLRKCPACVSFHWRNQWSVQFSVARRFAISERKLVLQGFYLQQV
ncbi:MAG: hypothetical protein KKA28_07425, partial [Planctomycetes bacterium]|nr:hypothetical protein [Planctomycetota bacterium]MCG2685533.1 hypothetical protein [Planctomycetales bacterium]